MQFKERKVSFPSPPHVQLRAMPLSALQPYKLVFTPIYLLLERNKKYVAVKGPLDFFTPEEIEKFKPFKTLHMTSFIEKIAPFTEVGRQIKSLLKENLPSQEPAPKSASAYPAVALGEFSFETSKKVLKELGGVWSPNLSIELFFICCLVNEICDPLSKDELERAKSESVDDFELRLIRSSLAVFLALHVGLCDFNYLNFLRKGVFLESFGRADGAYPVDETAELALLAEKMARTSQVTSIGMMSIKARTERLSRKVLSRLEKIEAELIDDKMPVISIFGEGGICELPTE